MYVVLAFDVAVYPSEVLERAAYRFSDRLALDLQQDGAKWRCLLHFDAGVSKDDVQVTVQSFRKEVVDQKLRAAIRSQTEAIRTLLLARAFSRTGLTPES